MLTTLPSLLAVLAPWHDPHGSAGFAAGFAHPFSGLDHLLAMLALGLWSAQLGAPYVRALPVAFPLAMSAGALAALAGLRVVGVEQWIALSAITLGLCVLTRARPRLLVAIGLSGLFAFFHGHAHGSELPAGAGAASFVAGFALATSLLHLCGIALALSMRTERGALAVRAAGLLVALAGAGLAWRTLG